MFLVVELCSSRDVVVVPDSWTTSQRSSTWWPPYQSTVQLNKAVHSQEAPGDEWGSHSIRTIHVEDSYNKARRKLAQAKRQSPGTHGVTLRRSERLKRALSQHTETGVVEEGTPHPKRRRTYCTRSTSDAPGDGTAVREPPAPPPTARRTRQAQLPSSTAVRRTLRTRLPPPPPPPAATSRRVRRARLPPPPQSTRRTRHARTRPPPSLSSSPRLLSILEKLQKSLSKLLRYLNVLLRLLTALKKYMMLQEILEKLPGLVEGIMDKISQMDRVPQMDRIPDIVVREIMQFVQREAERDEEEEEEEEEDQASFIREE